MKPQKVYEAIASAVMGRENCLKSGNTEWYDRHTATIHQLAKDLLPSGSGIDGGTTVNLEKSTGERLVFDTSFHHMNDGGRYDGWTTHTVTVRPGFLGLDLRISGRDRNGIKDYLAEVFLDALTRVMEETVVKTA